MEITLHGFFVLSLPSHLMAFVFIEWFSFILTIYLGVKCCNYMPYIVSIFFFSLTHVFTLISKSCVVCSKKIIKSGLKLPNDCNLSFIVKVSFLFKSLKKALNYKVLVG